MNSMQSIERGQWLLKGGRIIDPAVKMDRVADILLKNGMIESIGSFEANGLKGKETDCSGKIICPGFIDMHVHLREPGYEYKETIETGCQAAAAGGFTAVCCMPNTDPPIDNRGQVEYIKERSEGLMVDVHAIPAVTVGREGEILTEMGDMVEAGAVGFSDDGNPIKDSELMRRALEYAALFGHPIIEHCEDLSLTGKGMMNEGIVSTKMGLKGIPAASEDVIVARDLILAEYTQGPLHIAHVSTEGSVRLIRDAKKRGITVTAETCPHYLVLTDEAVQTFDTNTKIKPPLGSKTDQKALLQGLKEGTIDVIASDHAPHAIHEKETEYDMAAFGIVGLETAVGLMLTHLVDKKILSLNQLIEKMSIHPRRILQLPDNMIKDGEMANFTIIDPDLAWTVDRGRFLSKSKNSPFNGWHLKGKSVGIVNRGMLYIENYER